ncbi:MAG: UPF0489 family protein [Bryobacteraceae bacterium]
MTVVPVYVMEEHHEAFYVWSQSVRDGVLAPVGNTLIHVDEHSDMSLPRFRRPLGSIAGRSDLLDFTYNELDIGNFIWPAIYQGVFNRVCWVRLSHKSGAAWKSMNICAKNPARTEFITGSSLAGTPYENAPDAVRMEFCPVTTRDKLRSDQPAALDIDLDYFYSNPYPDYGDRSIEITRGAYEQFQSDRYHFLKIAPGSDVTAEIRDGRCFLRFNQYPAEPARESATEIELRIAGRIRDLAEWLRAAALVPRLVTVCRSVHSGYTPRTFAAFIESGLLDALHGVFAIRAIPFDEYATCPTEACPTEA